MRLYIIFFIIVVISSEARAQEYRRWEINEDGSISWKIKGDIPHNDHIEMSGKQISCVLRYGVGEDGSFHATRSLVWPMLRTIPNNTHASLTHRFEVDPLAKVTINGQPMAADPVHEIRIDGELTVVSTVGKDIEVTRHFLPSAVDPIYYEIYTIANFSQQPIQVKVPEMNTVYTTDPLAGTEGSYSLYVDLHGAGVMTVLPNNMTRFLVVYSGYKANVDRPPVNYAKKIGPISTNEWALRHFFVDGIKRTLVLETPDSILNTAFAFAKVRAAESIFETKGGPMHGPGGEAYYAAIWANDQAEYVGPFFPFLGYDYGNEASLNAYMHFARFINDAYEPIPSSIIAEGTDIWNGAGDRGDAAMIAYGAARYALASGDPIQSEKLWPLITWCLEYCRRHLSTEGVVISDTDELEGRFPAGSANLCTSSLYYDALQSAVYLGQATGRDKKQLRVYAQQAEKLKRSIEKYFGATIGGFETYKYYKENDTLRSWICIPLTMGIFDRKAGTIDALFSPQLWTEDGLATISGGKTFWDRSTLYALRGVFAAGETEKALEFLHYYSNRRLLGDHVPYPVEAYPEGSQRHLSAESGLYCRVFTEGLFGIRPTGLSSFNLTPQLPASWPSMSLRSIHAFDRVFDIVVEREGEKIKVIVSEGKNIISTELIISGETIPIVFADRTYRRSRTEEIINDKQ
jgi:hypothetical protein